MREIKTHLSRESANNYMNALQKYKEELFTVVGEGIDTCCDLSHNNSNSRGWWHKDGQPLERNIGELICLMHSELSEAMEGARKDLVSDHIPGFSMLEEELADTLVRIFDLAGALKLNLSGAFKAKTLYNMVREDHSDASRAADGGKKF